MGVNNSKIIIVDDHALFRDGLKTIIELSNIGVVVADVSNGQDLIDLLSTNKPDIVIMDLDMPIMNGVDATRQALKIYPDLKILAVTMYSDQSYYFDMVDAGAKGFVLKTSTKAELQNAIGSVLKGGNYFSSELIDDILKNINAIGQNIKETAKSVFNDKDVEILNLMVKGLSAKEIADETNLSAKTVSNYKTLMLEKTGCKNAIDLIMYAIKNKAIQM